MPAITIPASADELEEMLGDPAKMKPVLGDPKAFREFIRNYAGTVMNRQSELQAQVREQTQVILAEWLKEHGQDGELKLHLSGGGAPRVLGWDGASATGTPFKRHRLYNQAAPGASVNKLFTDQAAFFQALSLKCNALGTHRDAPDLLTALAEDEKIRNSFGTNVPADGGFLVPEQ